jgi:hypothetical protein
MRAWVALLVCVPAVATAGGDQAAATFEAVAGLPLFAAGLATAVGNGVELARGERSQAWAVSGLLAGGLNLLWAGAFLTAVSDPRGDPALHYGIGGGHGLLGALDVGLALGDLGQSSGGGHAPAMMTLGLRW